MPDVIDDSKNFNYFFNINCRENFITNKTSIGEIIEINKLTDFRKINNKIILIENADPGFDFLFSYKIKGLITEYGGANSHMSIRCLELGIPAIIGIGKRDYNLLSRKNFITINSKQKYYRIVR